MIEVKVYKTSSMYKGTTFSLTPEKIGDFVVDSLKNEKNVIISITSEDNPAKKFKEK